MSGGRQANQITAMMMISRPIRKAGMASSSTATNLDK